jgi:hypothetical protein
MLKSLPFRSVKPVVDAAQRAFRNVLHAPAARAPTPAPAARMLHLSARRLLACARTGILANTTRTSMFFGGGKGVHGTLLPIPAYVRVCFNGTTACPASGPWPACGSARPPSDQATCS